MYKLAFFVPDTHVEMVKSALFKAGAGKVGNYDHCSWQTKGQGQYRPMQGSQPFIGQFGDLERVTEWKVEMVCEDPLIHDVIRALKKAHPYEEVAYEVWPMSDL
jgi:hypothetical protein